jgi:hypothetical protein
MRAFTLGLAVAVSLGGFACSSPHAQPRTAGAVSDANSGPQLDSTRFVSATISRSFDSQGRATNDRLTVKSPEELAALEAFFREVGTGQRGPQAGGWMPAVVIKFKPVIGREVRVASNYEMWSEGVGNWPVKPALKDHLDRLFTHRTVSAVAQ